MAKAAVKGPRRSAAWLLSGNAFDDYRICTRRPCIAYLHGRQQPALRRAVRSPAAAPRAFNDQYMAAGGRAAARARRRAAHLPVGPQHRPPLAQGSRRWTLRPRHRVQPLPVHHPLDPHHSRC